MAEKTLATTLKFSAGYKAFHLQSGLAIAAGQVVYRDASDGLAKLAIATSLAPSRAIGVAANSTPGANQPLDVVYEGDITNLSGMTPGEFYFVTITTAGSLMLRSDLGSGNYPCLILQALTATTARLKVFSGGVAL